MSNPLIAPRWYGAHPGGELRVSLHPRVVLERIKAEVDELHSWHGGGVAFGRKPFLGEVKRAGFRVRTLSYRRDGAVGFLVGQVELSEGGTLVRYEIESPVGYVKSLPFAALAPAALLGIGAYLALPVLAPDGLLVKVAVVAGGSMLGLLLGAALISVVVYGIRRDTERLLGFVRSVIEGDER